MSDEIAKLDKYFETLIALGIENASLAKVLNDICDRISAEESAALLARLMAKHGTRLREAGARVDDFSKALNRLANLLWASSVESDR